MKALPVVLALCACVMTGCHRHRHYDDGPRYSKKARVKYEAKKVGHGIEHAGRKVGGKLQKFFRGHDTISED